MKNNKYFSVISVAVLGLFCVRNGFAQLKATSFPGTFQDVPFAQRVQTKAQGYEPYKDMKAYVIPEFKETDQKFKDQMCQRDREECCRRWPDYKNKDFSCQPQIIYQLYGGNKDKCGNSAPEYYYPNKGANITCIPTRLRSKFVAWCKDAGLKDCAPIQTIPVGERDDKFFWAKWECEDSSYILTQNSCDCSDINMDENCQCTGDGMSPTPNTDGKCECLSANARVQDGDCVCTKLSINDNCDPTPPPPDSKYVMIQCRTRHGTAPGMGRHASLDAAISALKCRESTQGSIDKCFTPCAEPGADEGFVNKTITSGVMEFCAGRWARTTPVYKFSDPSDPTKTLEFTKTQVDDAINKLRAAGNNYGKCEVHGRYTWYVFVYKLDTTSGAVEFETFHTIGL